MKEVSVQNNHHYVKKDRIYFFKQPFIHFGDAFRNASLYRKITMILNFILPGIGNLLLGAVEIGLIVFLVFFGLVFGEAYLVNVFNSGVISLSVLDAIVVFGLINVGIVVLYFSSFKLNVSSNYKLNNGLEIQRSFIFKFFKEWFLSIKEFFSNLSYQFKISQKKERIMLISSFFIMGIPLMCYK